MKPEIFAKAGGKAIRTILQQAERAGILEKHIVSGKKAGRRVTSFGKKFLEDIK
jgi:ribosomal protein S19E (S16A)